MMQPLPVSLTSPLRSPLAPEVGYPRFRAFALAVPSTCDTLSLDPWITETGSWVSFHLFTDLPPWKAVLTCPSPSGSL